MPPLRCVVRDQNDGQLRAEYGPCVVHLAALEDVLGRVRPLPVLRCGEFKRALQKHISAASETRRPSAPVKRRSSGSMLKGGEGSEVKIPASEEAGELVVQPSGLHTHTVILLHSMYCNAEMYARLYRRFGGSPSDPLVHGDVVVTHPEGNAWLHSAADPCGAAASDAADGKHRR